VFYLATADEMTLPQAFLIAGAWIPYEYKSNYKSDLHAVAPLHRIGYIQFPSKGLQLSAQAHQLPVKWPLVLQWIDTEAIGRLTGRTLAPFWIQFDPPALPALSPEKHLGYALQWFLFAGLWAGYGGYLLCRRQKGVSVE
jgi:cytochrome oxidase assembly protein ShyY1